MRKTQFRCQDPHNIFGILQKNRSEQVVSHVHVPDLLMTPPKNFALETEGLNSPWWFIDKVTAVTNENPLRRNCWLEKFNKCWVIKLGLYKAWAGEEYGWPGQVLIDSDGSFIHWTFRDTLHYTEGRLKMKKDQGSWKLYFYMHLLKKWGQYFFSFNSKRHDSSAHAPLGIHSDGDYNFAFDHGLETDDRNDRTLKTLVLTKPLAALNGLDSHDQEQKFLVQVDPTQGSIIGIIPKAANIDSADLSEDNIYIFGQSDSDRGMIRGGYVSPTNGSGKMIGVPIGPYHVIPYAELKDYFSIMTGRRLLETPDPEGCKFLTK
jgi:hypothetical protein